MSNTDLHAEEEFEALGLRDFFDLPPLHLDFPWRLGGEKPLNPNFTDHLTPMNLDQRLSTDQCLRITQALAPFEAAVIYIFGSFGSPAQHPASDIDIAFLPTAPAAPLDCFHIASELADQLGHVIDLVNLKQASTVLAKEVLLTGTPLFIGNPAIQQEFEMLVLANYARLNEERQAVLTP